MRAQSIVCLVLALFIATTARAELRVGVAKADLTPPIGGAMYGYGARGSNVSTGVHDPLYAKAIVLDDGENKLAIVTLDLGAFSDRNVAAVREKVRGAGIADVMLMASHSHSTARFADDFPSSEAPYPREVEAKVAEAIIEASRNLKPARIGVGWGEVREGHNRRFINADGTVTMLWGNRERVATEPVDYALAVVKVDTPEGEPIATLVNFACHPVVLGPENLEFSADYPGVFMRIVEEQVGGQCMFIQGAAGDINPFWDKTPPAEGGFEAMEEMGRALAEEIIAVREATTATEADPKISLHTEIVPIRKRWDLSDPEVQDQIRRTQGERRLQIYLARYAGEINAEVNTAMIGEELAIGGFPGEFFVEHGLEFKRRSPVKNTIFAGYCNGQFAYFPTIEACAQGGYGAASATIVEVGAGEMLVDRAIVNLYYQLGKLSRFP